MKQTKTNSTAPRNRTILYEGIGQNKRKIELFNFSKLDHILSNGRAFVRVLCDSKYYYFRAQETSISEIETF